MDLYNLGSLTIPGTPIFGDMGKVQLGLKSLIFYPRKVSRVSIQKIQKSYFSVQELWGENLKFTIL